MKEKRQLKAVNHLVLLLGSVMMLTPFVWMVLTSLKTRGEATAVPPALLPKVPQWGNYSRLFELLPFGQLYMNTIISAVCITIGQIVICAFAAYAFARLNFPLKNQLFVLVLSVLMVPGQVFLIPQYIIIQNLNLLDSIPALIIPSLFSAFGTFLLRQFFMTLPVELEEAARLDGCSRAGILFRIVMPLSIPGMVSLGIFALLYGWNALLWPLIVNTDPLKMTLAAGLSSFQGQYAVDYPLMMAGTFLAVVPLIILFLLFQKQFIQGIALTGSKG